jgi:hypothetical protein
MAWPLTSPASAPLSFAGPGDVVPTVSTEIGNAQQLWLIGLHFINKDTVARTVVLTNSAGKELYRRTIEANSDTPPYEPTFRPSLGLKWSVNNGNGGDVLGHVWGYR